MGDSKCTGPILETILDNWKALLVRTQNSTLFFKSEGFVQQKADSLSMQSCYAQTVMWGKVMAGLRFFGTLGELSLCPQTHLQ